MGIEEHILEQLRRVFQGYPTILAVYAFGSRATGLARKDSDYDLAIVSRSGESSRDSKLDILADLVSAGIDNVDLAFLDHDNIVLSREAVRMNQLIFRRPEIDSAADIPRLLHEHGHVDEALQETWIRMIGFRNILVHDYLDNDRSIVYDALQSRLKDIQALMRVFAKFL